MPAKNPGLPQNDTHTFSTVIFNKVIKEKSCASPIYQNVCSNARSVVVDV